MIVCAEQRIRRSGKRKTSARETDKNSPGERDDRWYRHNGYNKAFTRRSGPVETSSEGCSHGSLRKHVPMYTPMRFPSQNPIVTTKRRRNWLGIAILYYRACTISSPGLGNPASAALSCRFESVMQCPLHSTARSILRLWSTCDCDPHGRKRLRTCLAFSIVHHGGCSGLSAH